MSDSILEVKNLSVEFRGTEVVHDVSFHIERGETVAIVFIGKIGWDVENLIKEIQN